MLTDKGAQEIVESLEEAIHDPVTDDDLNEIGVELSNAMYGLEVAYVRLRCQYGGQETWMSQMIWEALCAIEHGYDRLTDLYETEVFSPKNQRWPRSG